jgi:hypothetical protein
MFDMQKTTHEALPDGVWRTVNPMVHQNERNLMNHKFEEIASVLTQSFSLPLLMAVAGRLIALPANAQFNYTTDAPLANQFRRI